VDVRRLDPFSTFACWTIYSILCGKFLELAIPGLLELDVKELIDMFKRNVIGRATFGRHMLWISY
jgi:hypothetical protein